MTTAEEPKLEKLFQGAQHLGLELSQRQLEQFDLYRRLMLQWNHRVNLTSIVDYENVQLLHFLDSLTVLEALPSRQPHISWRVIDLGTGAGLPGIPLKLAWPELELVLVESVAKKTAFLQHLVAALELEAVEVITARAEELGQMDTFRERFDLTLARGLAKLSTLVELALPFCKRGGLFIAQKKGAIQRELDEARDAIATLGGRLQGILPISIDGLPAGRVLVVIEKIAATPLRYPRRTGVPAKRPLIKGRGSGGFAFQPHPEVQIRRDPSPP